MPRAANRSVSRSVLVALLTWLWLPVVGCERRTAPDPEEASVSQRELESLPDLDLSAAEPAAREQLEAQRREATALAASGADDREVAAAYGQLGLLYLTYEFLGSAEAAVRNARRLAGDDFRWAYLLGYLRLVQGDVDEAVAQLEASLELQPDYAPALLRLGRARTDAGDPVAAREDFRAALALDPELAAAHEGLGRTALALGEPEAALDHFRRALVLDPRADALHYAIAQALQQLGRLDEAREALAASGEAVSQIPDPILRPLGALAQGVQFFLMQGSEAMVAGRYDEASASFRMALDRDPSTFDAYRGLAISLERLGDPEGAFQVLSQGLEQVGAETPEQLVIRRAALHRSLGLLARAEGRDRQAVEHYLQSLELVPEQPGLLLRAADGLARHGRFEEAIRSYDALLALEPAWGAMLWEKRATAWVNLGKRTEAVADFERAVAAAPDDARLRERYAKALEHLQAGPQAAAQRAVAEQLAGEAPGQAASVLVERARQRARDGELDSAVASFRRALELEPERHADRQALASLLAHMGRLGDARGELKTVLASMPRNRAAHRDLVAVLVLDGRHGEAREALQDALRQFPQHVGFALTQVELLATSPQDEVRDGRLALDIAQRVTTADAGPVARQSLAFALAAAGRFGDAVAIQQELVDQAEAAGRPQVAEALRQRLERFEAGQVWIAASPEEILAPLMASP